MSEKISIIMPAYNAAPFIAESIESVLAQSHTDWELIVVDDESSDNTAVIAKSYQSKDRRIKYVWQKNGKQGRARNKGIEISSGEYFAFLDADDVWLPEKLAHQLELLKRENADLVFGYSNLIENNIRTEKTIGRGLGKYQGTGAVDFLLYHDAYIMSTVFATCSAIREVGGFSEDLRIQYCEDWHIWLNLALSGHTSYTDARVVSYYRLHTASVAMSEVTAQIKFFYALLDLHHKYPSNDSLTQQVKVRIHDLIFHSESLSGDLVSSMFSFLDRHHYVRFSFFYKFLHRLDIRIFRKVFLKTIH